jgi:propanol-preferring alcohol dehydrogenase
MKAARLHAYQTPLVVEEIPTPRPVGDQVLVKVAGAGFCHSDVHVIDGEIRVLPRFPITLGHENAGFVTAVGSEVKALREGDPVLVFGGWGCGPCDYCVGGNEQLCVAPEWAGLSHRDGGYAEYLLVPHERYLIKLGKLSPQDAAPLADAALTPYRAIRKAQPFLDPDYAALVIGVGGLGEYGIELLRLLSGCPVIAVDVSEPKRRAAKSLGATHVLDGNDPEITTKIMDLTRGRGVAAAFDFVGSDATLALAIGTTRALGKVTQVGLAGGTARLHVLENSRFEVQFEATLWGTVRELREVVALAESGRLRSIPLEFSPLDRINDVYARIKRGEITGRAVIVP